MKDKWGKHVGTLRKTFALIDILVKLEETEIDKY